MKLSRLRAGRAFAAAAGLLSGLGLAGCLLAGGDSFFLSRGGGGEDFPNTVTPLAKELAKEAVSSADWGQVASVQIPELPDLNVIGDLRIEPIELSKVLGKRAAAKRGLSKGAADGLCDTSYISYTDFEILTFRRGRKIVCAEDGERIRRDTLQFWLRDPIPDSLMRQPRDTALILKYVEDSAVLIEAWGRIQYKGENANRAQSYRAWNTDSLGAPDYGDYVTTTTEASAKTVQRARLYGRDGAYQKDGAPPAWYEMLKTSGRDTLDWQRMSDADGDSALWDRVAKEGAKGLVNFERRAKDPADAPAAAALSQKMRAVLHHAPGRDDSLVTRWYFDERALKTGATARFAYRGAGPDSALNPFDTALIALDTVFGAADSMSSYHADYRMLSGAHPSDAAGRSLLGFSVDKAWRRGKLKTSSTQFAPLAPLAAGQPFIGRMAGQTLYRNGDQVYSEGAVDAVGMTLTMRVVSKDKVEVYLVTLDLQGNVKEMRDITKLSGGDTSARVDTSRLADTPARADTSRVDSVRASTRAP